MSDCFVLYLLLTCMKKKTSGADKFTNNNYQAVSWNRRRLLLSIWGRGISAGNCRIRKRIVIYSGND